MTKSQQYELIYTDRMVQRLATQPLDAGIANSHRQTTRAVGDRLRFVPFPLHKLCEKTEEVGVQECGTADLL